MNKIKRYLLPALIIAMLVIPTFAVLAKELGSLTITGPGINGELTVSDPRFTLEQSGFFDQAALATAPDNLNLDAGYAITAHLNLDGKVVPFVQMVYYPIDTGQPGYIHYTGRLEGETLRTVDEWGILSLSADTAFRALMTANKVTLQSALVAASANSEAASAAEPVVVPVTSSPAPLQSSYVVLAIAATVMLLVGAGFVIRRRTVNRTTT